MTVLRGIAYPLQLENGTLKVATDLDLRRGHIRSVLETYKLERVMNAEYGLPHLVFSSVNRAAVVAERIRLELTRQIVDVDFEVNGSIDDSGTMSIEVIWRYRGALQTPLRYRLTSE